MVALHSGALDLRRLPPDIASTAASLVGSTPDQPRRIHQPQLLASHPCERLHPSQLSLAHLCPPQSDLLMEILLGGHFYRGQKGTLSLRFNTHFYFQPQNKVYLEQI